MRTLHFTLALILLFTAAGCALLQRADEKVERFLLKVQDMIDRWEAGGLLPPAMATRVRDAVEWARENWREGKANLILAFEEVLEWLAGHAVPLDEWDAALARAQADGILSPAEDGALRSR